LAGTSFIWYQSGTLIPGVNTRKIKAVKSAYYTVVYDSTGCLSPLSDSIQILLIGVENASSLSGADLKLYPNPTTANAYLNVVFDDIDETTLRIVDMLGKELLVIEKGRVKQLTDETIDLTHYQDGVYQLQVTHGSQIFTRKLMKSTR
jgi:hypothetical protein